MKKLSLFLLTGVMVFSLTACGNKDAKEENTGDTTGVIENTDGIIDENEDVPGNTEMEESTDGAGEIVDGVVGDVVDNWTDEMRGFRDAVVGVLDTDYMPDTALDVDVVAEKYGITEDMYEDIFAESFFASTNIDTLLIVKAKDDKVEEVEKALNTYRDAMIEDTMQYPVNVAKIQGSKIETIGNYVILAMLGGDNMAAMEEGDEAAIQQSKDHNDKAIEALRGVIEK